MIEIVLKDVGTVILDASEANFGDIHRVTGWCVSQKDRIVNYNGGKSHAKTTKGTHQVCEWKGAPRPGSAEVTAERG